MTGNLLVQITMLVGRHRDSLMDQIDFVNQLSIDSENFELVWSLALQDESLRASLRAINEFLIPEGYDPLPEEGAVVESLEAWKESLLQRFCSIDKLYNRLRQAALQEEWTDELFQDVV